MPPTPAEIEAATSTTTELPTDPAELARMRGDAPDGAAPEPAADAQAAEPLSEEEQKDAEEEVKPLVEKKEGEDERAQQEEPDDRPRDEQGRFIPKARFDEMRQKKDARIKAAEERAQKAEEALKLREGPATVKEAEAQIDEKTEKYQELLAEGKLAEAKVIFKEINALNRHIARLEMLPHLTEVTRGQIEAATLEEVVEFYQSEFPEFSEGPGKNQALVDEAMELCAGYEQIGYSPAAALKKAADMVIRANSLVPLSERGKKAKGDAGARRKADAVAANVDAASRQPPPIDKVGTDSDKIGASNVDVFSLSEKDFEALPESMRKRLRGD